MNEPGAEESFWLRVLVILLILAGIILTVFFGVRLLHSVAEVHSARLRPGETDVQLIRSWMTIPYIARAYRVPEEVLWQGLNIAPEGNRHKSLRILDREFAGGQPGAVIDKVRAAIHAYQSKPSPTSTAPPK